MLIVVPSRFQQCWFAFTMPFADVSSETGFFRHFFKHVFGGPQFRKYISYERLLFFGKHLKFYVDFKNPKINIDKKFLETEVIASELGALNSLYYEGNTCHGQSMP